MESVLSDGEAMQLLIDDAPFGDLTTSLLVDKPELNIHFYAREDMIVSGVEEAIQMMRLKNLDVKGFCQSGDKLSQGQHILSAKGHSSQLFIVWKATQILMEWMSGVASSANSMVLSAGDTPVACTRKQTPFTKALSVKAIRSGGAVMHRLGLSETILVFAEHRQFINYKNPKDMLDYLHKSSPEHKVVLEVHSVEDAKMWIEAGVEVLQLDKFSIDQVTECKIHCQNIYSTTRLAIAGGVNPGNVAQYAEAGADLIVTSAPYYAKPKDIKVVFED
ncbi:ModD protein [Vibrio sp.]|uniref:Putative pyrophosphorylase ModD n=1 Tax=Vibrio viridaestus TaxID=2487322 RepID=A0A3N9U473_9VIBR|nr:ModD protein [Vibrio viridaestus]MDC0610287.1 ModD protein [Vibrio sp.]RQW64382.1 ModD protein [Vibrio viridaestus]